MTPKAEQELITIFKGMRADMNANAQRLSGEIVNLTQELFLSRKVAELMLSEAGRGELARFAPPVAPSPDLEHQAATQHQVTAEQQAEIDRALMEGELQLGLHGLPVLSGAR